MSSITGTAESIGLPSAHPKRLALASMVGTTLEYYDFTIYNTMAALVFSQLFFPSVDPMVGTMLAFSTYAIGYLSRPLGGLFFGRLGDKIGRRAVLVITLIIMGLTTATIGLLPTYGSAGILAPLLLITLRFVQGVALGGEWAGAVLLAVEHGRQDQRGLNASWTQMGPALGTLLGTGLIYGFTSLMDNETFLAWGWRVPFLLSLALVTFGLWVRSGVEESPMFKQLEEAHTKAKAPIKEVVTNHWRRLLLAGGSRIGGDVLYGLVVVFTLTYVTTVLQLPKSTALMALLIGTGFNALAVPLFAILSDHWGRRPVLALGVVSTIVWAFLMFALLDTTQTLAIVLASVGGLIVHACLYGPQTSFIIEQFPTRIRFTGASLAYTFAGIIGGGFAPLIMAALFKSYSSSYAISIYVAGAACVTGLVLLLARETAHKPLEE